MHVGACRVPDVMAARALQNKAAVALLVLGACSSAPADAQVQRPTPEWHDGFDWGLDERKWEPELSQTGGGNNEFEMYVNSRLTAEVKQGILHLKPTLTEAIMEELDEVGENFVAREERWISELHQPISSDYDFEYHESVAYQFAGRRLVLPFKHVRYTSNHSNVCFDNQSEPVQMPDCENMWAHRYNAMDMNTQTWASGRWPHVRCTQAGGCFHHAGDWFQSQDIEDGVPQYTMLQPVASAKLRTRMILDMRFGRLEVTAKLPKGDWLWPAIWMMPTHDVYGRKTGSGWPMNGEIDIVESRGNTPNACSGPGGYNSFGGCLHWGPSFELNQYARTCTRAQFSGSAEQNETLVDDWHVYGVAWDENSLYTYLDDDTNRLLELKREDVSNGGLWAFAQRDTQNCDLKSLSPDNTSTCVDHKDIPAADFSGEQNLWQSGGDLAPFDQPFYLQMNVAVGGATGDGQGGYFPAEGCDAADGSAKPWQKGLYDYDAFMKNTHAWLPTWVKKENIAWAVHCGLGSAFEGCMPANHTLPLTDMTTPGAAETLKQWYNDNKAKCVGAAPGPDACAAMGDGCEYHGIAQPPPSYTTAWRAIPCPPTADHASLRVDKVEYWKHDTRHQLEL